MIWYPKTKTDWSHSLCHCRYQYKHFVRDARVVTERVERSVPVLVEIGTSLYFIVVKIMWIGHYFWWIFHALSEKKCSRTCVGAPPSIPLMESCLPSCAPNFPCDLSHSSRKMTAGPCVCARVRVVITCDITTLISSPVIVKSPRMERLNNGKARVEGLRVCCQWSLDGLHYICRNSFIAIMRAEASDLTIRGLKGGWGGDPFKFILTVFKSWLDDNLLAIIALLLTKLIWLMDSFWRE